MSTTEDDQQALSQSNVKYVFNFFNIPQPNMNSVNNNNNNTNNNNASNSVTDPRSPNPSIISDNSVECSLSGHNMVSDAPSSSSEDSEQELTSLAWLTELRNQSLTWPDSVQPIIDDDCFDRKLNGKTTNGSGGRVNGSKLNDENQSALQKRPTPAERYEIFLDKVKKDIAQYNLASEVYKTDVGEKPPFNYSHIIGMAMVENGRMTLQQICSWIESKFAFFRVRKKWNNSIRHNLSLHHCFRKIDRSKYEKGKGGYWELGIDPRKCDRKRIRNRKTSNRKRTLVGEEVKDHHRQFNVVTTVQDCAEMSPTSLADQVEEFVLDELDVQQNIVITKDTRDNAVKTDFMTSSQQPVTNDSRLCHFDVNNPIQLQDVFIADMSNNDCSKVNSSNFCTATDAEYQLGTIIVNSSVASAAELGGPAMSMSNIQNEINRFVEGEIPQPCENVVISSYLSNAAATLNQGQPNVIVEQMEPYYTISTSDSNFRPYIDSIDEAFHYLRSMDSRCEDLFDNLLDISVSDY